MKKLFLFLFFIGLIACCCCRMRFVKFFPNCGNECDALVNRYVLQYNASIVNVDLSATSDGGRYFHHVHRYVMLTYCVPAADEAAHSLLWVQPAPPVAPPVVESPPPWAARKMH